MTWAFPPYPKQEIPTPTKFAIKQRKLTLPGVRTRSSLPGNTFPETHCPAIPY